MSSTKEAIRVCSFNKWSMSSTKEGLFQCCLAIRVCSFNKWSMSSTNGVCPQQWSMSSTKEAIRVRSFNKLVTMVANASFTG